MKLNQVIAIMKGTKKTAADGKTSLYQRIQKTALFQGISRIYSPVDDDGYVYPPESQKVTFNAETLLQDFVDANKELFDIAATQDWANTKAKADVKVGEKVILKAVPVTYLMFLEKQLIDIKTFVKTLPVLPIENEWEYDESRGVFASEVKKTTKTKKISDFVIAAEATKEHPAQVREVSKDVVEGVWDTQALSGALTQDRVDELFQRTEALLNAVISAREEANSAEVKKQEVSSNIFDYLFK